MSNFPYVIPSITQNHYNVKDFGATGDGVTDDTAAILAAAAAIGATDYGKELFFPEGTYILTDRILIESRNNFTIRGYNAIIKGDDAMPITAGHELIQIKICNDWTMRDLQFDGNQTNRGSAELTIHNVSVQQGERWSIENCYSYDSPCDGFYISAYDNTDSTTFPIDFTILNCVADGSYRQGMSIINSINGNVIGGAYINSDGIAPQSGIDIEANASTALPANSGLTIRDVRLEGNTGDGILMSSGYEGYGISIQNCYFEDNDGNDINVGAYVDINGCSFVNRAVTTDCIDLAANANANAIVTNCRFKDFTSTGRCISTGSTGKLIASNNYFEDITTAFVCLADDCIISENQIIGSSLLAINVSGDNCRILNNQIRDATARAIYCTGTYAKVDGNVCDDVSSVSGAYIQCEGSGSVIINNILRAATSQATTYGVRSSSSASVIAWNQCINLHTTDPFTFTDNYTGVFFAYNVGASNGLLVSRNTLS